MAYTVLVAENSHYMDEAERYKHGEFATIVEARAAARALVNSELVALHAPGMSADELYRQYTTFGAEPFIVPADADENFSAWAYAAARCQELCQDKTQTEQSD
ncbi:MAG: hypothetical protein ACJ74W_06415 [Pyrinomonadaceae bacterium]